MPYQPGTLCATMFGSTSRRIRTQSRGAMSAAVEVVSEDRELIEWRRHLHRHPELAFHEHRTAAFVADKLREFGLHPITGIAGTGLAVAIEGGKPGPCCSACRWMRFMRSTACRCFTRGPQWF